MKLYICETMDGYIARPDGSIDFLDEINSLVESSPNEEIRNTYNIFIQDIKNVVEGFNTYLQVSEMGFADAYAKYNHYVITNEHRDYKDKNVTKFINFDELVELNLKNEETFLVGGSQIIKEAFKRELISELIIFKLPIFIGAGIPLFKGIEDIDGLEVKAVIHDGKFVQTHYIVK